MTEALSRLSMSIAIFCTAFMLRGLLYVGYKKVRYEQAKKELARVSDNIEEFSGDILAMQPRSALVAIVARQP